LVTNVARDPGHKSNTSRTSIRNSAVGSTNILCYESSKFIRGETQSCRNKNTVGTTKNNILSPLSTDNACVEVRLCDASGVPADRRHRKCRSLEANLGVWIAVGKTKRLEQEDIAFITLLQAMC
jgi:hypothetical protein